MKTCGLLVLLWLCVIPVFALDSTQPASVQIRVEDAAGHPLPQAAVLISTGTVRLNALGTGQYETSAPQPASDIFWTEPLRVTLPGYLPFQSDLRFFPGARLDLPITLYPPHTTRLHLRGPAGEAVSGVSVQVDCETADPISLSPVNGYTDTQGDFIFTHPPMKSGFILSAGTYSRNFRSRDYPDAGSVTITLTQAEMPSSFPPHPLQLTLIAPDGTPAAGWQVASHVNFTGSWGVFSGFISQSTYTNYYTASGLVRTDKDGKAVLPITGEKLAVFSPSGIPLLYPLNPQTWPSGLHSVTLRLPPVPRTQAGRLTYPDGRPGVCTPIEVYEARTGTEKWQIQTNEPIGKLMTDAEGRYSLPQYAGTHFQYEARMPPFYAYDLSTAEGSVLNDTTPSTGPAPSEVKEVTVQFVDERRQPLPEIDVDTQGQFSSASDTRGVHLFLPTGTDHIDIKTKAENWNTLTKTLTLSGTTDKVFTITVPQSLRFKPLRGILTDPNDTPVRDVSINLYGINPRPGTPNSDYLRLSTKADSRGRFAFAAAPDSCEIDLYRFGADDQPNLPGWTEPPVATPQTREIRVRLKPFLTSTVRALLPPSVQATPKQIYLEYLPAGHLYPDYLFPLFDAKAHTLLWNRIPPGQYHLKTEDETLLPVTARLDQQVTLTQGRQTVIDLRKETASFPQPPVQATVRLYLGGQASGAVVTLWTDQPAYSRHLPADLVDDDGFATLPIGLGQHSVVVAHDAGRSIGEMEVNGEDSGALLSCGMQPTQTLRVPLEPLPLVNGKAPYDRREVTISPANMKPDEAQALFLVLGLLSADTGFLGEGPVPSGQLIKDADGAWVAPDLPPGTYHVQIGSDVTLP